MISLDDIKHWHSLETTNEKEDYYFSKIMLNGQVSVSKMEEWHEQFKRYDPKEKSYLYLCTFTKKEPSDDDDTIEEYIKKQFTRKPLKVKQAYIAKEKTANNVSHWHVAVETLKALKKDRFNYYIKKYGFVDISKSKGTNIETPLNYISKDTLPLKII